MKKERYISYGLAVLALTSLVACSSTPTGSRVEGITTTVDAPAVQAKDDGLQGTITAELESWEERLSEMRDRAMTTRSPERFKQLNKAIQNIEGELAVAREDFLHMRIAASDGERLKYKRKVNDTLVDIRAVYNGVPAE